MRVTNVKRIAPALGLLGGATLAGAGGVVHASPTHIDVGYVDNNPSMLRISGGGFAPGDTINLAVYALPHKSGTKPLTMLSVSAQPATTYICGYYGSFRFCYDAPNPRAGTISATVAVNPRCIATVARLWWPPAIPPMAHPVRAIRRTCPAEGSTRRSRV